jgi:hypothetical protein
MESFYQQPLGAVLAQDYDLYSIMPMIMTSAIIATKSKMLTHVGKGLFSTLSIMFIVIMIK